MQRADAVRRRDPLVPGVLHRADAGGADRSPPHLRRRIQARGIHRHPAPADPGHRGAGPGLQQGGFAALVVRGRPDGGGARPRHRRRPRHPLERLMSQVNLLPPEILAAQRQRRLAGVVALAGVGVIGLDPRVLLLQLSALSGVQDDIETAEQNNAGLQRDIEELQEFEALRDQAQAKQALLNQVFANEISFSGLLMDVSRVIPSDAALTSFTATARSPRPTTGGSTLLDGPDRRGRSRHGLRHDRVLADAPRADPRLGEPVGDLDRRPGDGTDHVRVGGRPHDGRGHGARPASRWVSDAG